MAADVAVDLRRRLVRGGAALAVREAAGMLLSIITVVVVLRALGPAAYALAAVALTTAGFVNRLGGLGLDAYIARHPAGVTELQLRRIFSLVLVASGFAAGGVVVFSGSIARLFGLEDAAALVAAASLFVWLWCVSRVPLAVLEHRLQYRAVAAIELLALVAYQVTAVALVLAGAGAWSIVTAMIVQAAVATAVALHRVPIRPALDLRSRELVAAVRYAAGFQASTWVWTLRDVVGPIVVGRALGATALGILAAAFLVLNRALFVRNVVWRVSLVGLGKVQRDLERLRRGLSEAMVLQAALVSGVLIVVAALAPDVLPPALGSRWTPAVELFPLLAAAALVNALFSLHSSALFACGHLRPTFVFHAAFVLTLAISAATLVPTFGLRGYAAAELVAVWAYVVPVVAVARTIGALSYAVPLTVTLASAALLLAIPELARGPRLAIAILAIVVGCALVAARRGQRPSLDDPIAVTTGA